MSTYKSLIKSAKPKVEHIKKPLIFLTAASVAFLIIFVFISAFDNNKSNSKSISVKTSIPLINSDNDKIPTIFQSLPKSYADTDAIKKFSHSDENDGVINDLKRALEALQKQDEDLQHELANLNDHQQKNNIRDPKSEQASSSGIFFLNTAPQKALSNNNDVEQVNQLSKINDPNTNSKTITEDAQFPQKPLSEQIKFYKKISHVNQQSAVLKATDNVDDIYDLHNLTIPVSPYEILAGTIIPAVLLTGIDTSVAGTIVAQLRLDIFDSISGKYLLIPKGSKIIGEYDTKISYGQRRILISFNRLIRPDGTSILIGKPTAADLQGEAGISGNINNHWGKILGAATLSTILSVGAGVISDNSGDKNSNYRSAKQNAILGAGSGISQAGEALTSRALEIPPTITIPGGLQFNIIVRRDMVLTPFHNK